MILFSLFVSKKGARHSYRGGGGHVLFTKYTKYTLNLPYIFIQKNLISLYNFGQKWLDTLHKVIGIKRCHHGMNVNHQFLSLVLE
jgi:hypothetical protein